QMCDMEAIKKISKKYGLKIIEDAAQAHGATYKGKKPGHYSDAACFSFYHTKNLGGYGNGGMVITQKKEVMKKIRMLRNPESNTLFLLNSKRTPTYLDTIQIAFLKIKLKYLDSWIKKRREIAEKYKNFINRKDIILPKEDSHGFHTYRDFPILTKKRNMLKYYFLAKGIETRIHYPLPIHLTKTYNHLGYKKNDFPITENICKTVLSLPIHPFLKEEEINYINKNLNNFFF
ncbi:MAG: DegT/DnrJ/EryC1/StrS family aminotransferase, partial [Nanoarchaeota archaeon]|nr:DegT/DnrJ/EryC1/StrS family aminotransferase [Nanoarchaeota archaeon]